MKHLKFIFTLLLSILILSGSLFSQTGHQKIFRIDSISKEISLNHFWKYKAGDDTLWAKTNYDDSNWDTLQTILNLEEIPEGKFDKNCWFRLHIQIDSSLINEPFSLSIDQNGASEIYLNGRLLKRFGKVSTPYQEEKAYNPRHLSFMSRFSDTLDYILAIRYSNTNAAYHFKKFGEEEAGFTISISNHESSIKIISTIGQYRNFFVIILSVFISIGFLHLLLYLFYRRQASNLYFFLFMAAASMIWVVVLYAFSISEDPVNSIQKIYYFRLGIVLSFPLLSIFIYSIFYPKFPKISWGVIASIPAIVLIVLFFGTSASKIVNLINLVILIDIIRNIIRAIIKKQEGAWIIGAGFLFFVLFFLMVAFLGVTSNKEIITTPGSLMAIVILSTFLPAIVSIPLSMSIYLARDFAKTNKDLEKQLENVKALSAKTLEQEREKKRILENQKEKLEIMVKERTKELAQEKEKTEELLLNTLPLKVVNELKENGKSEPENFDDVTVYFSDIVGFTKISSKLDPKTLISELNDIFTAFDDIIIQNKCERIKTIGDAYLAVSGMPNKNKNHAENMVKAAIEIKHYLEERNNTSEIKWQTRIGIHSGKVVGGIVGVRKYIYDVFGDTINTASRMESNSEPMRINVSEATYNILKEKYNFIEREVINVKGKGDLKMYFLDA